MLHYSNLASYLRGTIRTPKTSVYTTDRGSESGTGNAELFSRASPSIVGPLLYIIQTRHAKTP
jgi:hypothetical protein